MKNFLKRFITVFLCFVLAAGVFMPAKAQNINEIQLTEETVYVTDSRLLGVAGPMPGDEQDYLTAWEDAVSAVRQGLESRQNSIVVAFATEEHRDQLEWDILQEALSHTGEPTQGDYLRWQLGGYRLSTSQYSAGGRYYLTITYKPRYYTTAEQETQLDAAVKNVLDQLDVYDATDYEKVCAVYDYICNNVEYDYEGLATPENKLIYTAYAALINGKSVCQGYANLFYRLMLELDVDARIVTGIGNDGAHGWNIVQLDGKYYNLDATWDAPRAQYGVEYDYFLRTQADFEDHSRDEEFLSAEFMAAYPMAEANYTPSTQAVVGDLDGDRAVTRNDVIRLLLYVTLPDRFPVSGEVDFNGDGQVTRDDVIRLLLHVTLPGRFPLTA